MVVLSDSNKQSNTDDGSGLKRIIKSSDKEAEKTDKPGIGKIKTTTTTTKKSSSNEFSILHYGLLIGGIILLVIIILAVMFFKKKK